MLLSMAGTVSEPPGVAAPRRRKELVEGIITRSTVPTHLLAGLMWEESGLNPLALRRESNGTCSSGLLQFNGPCGRRLNPEGDAVDGLRIAEHWWSKSKHDWAKTKLAFRMGHLPNEKD